MKDWGMTYRITIIFSCPNEWICLFIDWLHGAYFKRIYKKNTLNVFIKKTCIVLYIIGTNANMLTNLLLMYWLMEGCYMSSIISSSYHFSPETSGGLFMINKL